SLSVPIASKLLKCLHIRLINRYCCTMNRRSRRSCETSENLCHY
ncbi:unnamed protein product, partial [Allacma fusca]